MEAKPAEPELELSRSDEDLHQHHRRFVVGGNLTVSQQLSSQQTKLETRNAKTTHKKVATLRHHEQ